MTAFPAEGPSQNRRRRVRLERVGLGPCLPCPALPGSVVGAARPEALKVMRVRCAQSQGKNLSMFLSLTGKYSSMTKFRPCSESACCSARFCIFISISIAAFQGFCD